MIDTRVIHQYMRAAEAGKVPVPTCPVGNDHLPLITGYDKLRDIWFLRCLTCDYKLYFGLSLYDRMVALLQTVDNTA